MTARVLLPVGAPRTSIAVPRDAIVLGPQGAAVYVVREGIAHAVPVSTGAAEGQLIEVRGELRAGERVVVRGNERLRPGQPVAEVAGRNR
jgi:multidrug efflux pump subunit AcrA (membrane-fusion protein)